MVAWEKKRLKKNMCQDAVRMFFSNRQVARMKRWGIGIAQISVGHLFSRLNFFLHMPSSSFLPLCHLQSPFPSPSKTRLPLLIYLSFFKDGQSVTVERSRGSEKEEEGVCTMQSRASVAKVGRLRWGVSIARAHWCMNAEKSNASLDRQEGVGKVKPAC